MIDMIIALMGLKGSGKNTAAQRLVENHNFTSIAFADSVKDACATIFCWDRQLIEGNTPESREWREQIDPWWAEKLEIPHFTPRFALQHIGTNLLRNSFCEQIWIHNVERRLHQIEGNVVINDGRFPNEIEMVRRLGGKVYRIKRGEDPQWLHVAHKANCGDQLAKQKMIEVYGVHESEWAWTGISIDGVLNNNGDRYQLWEKVDKIC